MSEAAAAAPSAPATPAPEATPDATSLLNQSQQPEQSEQPELGVEEKPDVPQGAPENYADFTMPEGIEIDKAALESFTPVAKELNLTQEQAQKLVDMYATQLNSLQIAQNEQVVQMRKDWVAQVREDQEIGGAKFTENIGAAVQALIRYGTPELRQALDQTGLGDHPEMIRFCYRIGKAISEDALIPGSPAVPKPPKTAAEIIYPNQNNI